MLTSCKGNLSRENFSCYVALIKPRFHRSSGVFFLCEKFPSLLYLLIFISLYLSILRSSDRKLVFRFRAHRQRVAVVDVIVTCPKKPLLSQRSGTQYVAVITKISSSYCGAHRAESYCKESNNSDANWLAYPCLSYLTKIWLSVWHL